MKKLKILYLAPKRAGGPHLSLKKLYKHLTQTNQIEADFEHSLSAFLKAILTNKYDIIHSVLPVPFNLTTPILLSIRGNYKIERSRKNPLAYLYPITIKTAKKIVSPSKFLANKLKLKNIQIIPNFVNEDVLKYKAKYKSNQKIKLAIMTKFHFYEKASGVLDLLEVLDGIKNIELSVLGSGDYLEQIKKESKKYDVKIKWLGFVKEPHKFLQTQDIFTFWSNLDNFPNAVLESMAIGLPTITNNVGAVREFVKKDAGFVCDKKEYKKVLTKLIENPNLRKKTGLNARKHIEENYTVEAISQEFMKVYKNIYKRN